MNCNAFKAPECCLRMAPNIYTTWKDLEPVKSAIDASLLHTMNLATLIFFNASGLVLIAILRAMLFTTKGWIYRYRGTAMVDKFGVMCKDWTDPEDIGILYYTIACEHFAST